jgi:predicted cobalt transporter CbtA
VPHLYGAHLDEYTAAAPEALAHQFIVAVTVTSFLFWGVLGAATGYFCGRFQIGGQTTYLPR